MFHGKRTAGEPLRYWVPILLETIPVNANSDLLAYMITHCTMPDDQYAVLQLFRKLTSPRIHLRRRFFPPGEGQGAAPDAEVAPIGSEYWVTHVYRSHLQPHIDALATDISRMVTSAFEEARTLLLMYGKANPKWDPISFSRGSTASRIQDHLRNGFSTLIDAGADVLCWANEQKPLFAKALIAQWIESDAPILRRLAITGMTSHPLLTPDEKLSWAISNRFPEDVQLKNEMFALLAEVYAASGERNRAEFLAQAEATYAEEGEEHERYELFNLLSWLHAHAPECELVAEKLQRIQERHPQWGVREHPDFNSWIGGGVRQLVPDSPVPASEIQDMNLEALVAECARLATMTDPFGDSSKAGFLQEIARTTAANFSWSEARAREALISAEPPTEIWSALLRGWSSTHTEEEWTSALQILRRLEPVYGSVLHELASLLNAALDEKKGNLPRALLGDALEIANAVWEVCTHNEPPLPDSSDDWVAVAINRTSGYLMDFYFDALRSVWQARDQEQQLIQYILDTLREMIAGDSPASEIARVLVPANAHLLAAMAQDWYQAHTLPLLSAPASRRSSEQSWDGYLVWGQWSQDMLPGLLPAYLNHLPAVTAGSDERSRKYCDHLAGIAILGAVDPIENGWLDEFLLKTHHRERLNWAVGITQILREVDGQTKESAWDRWIRRYLQRRVQANPIPLDSAEAGAMCEWALVLKPHYVEIVELLLTGPAPSVKGNMFYYRLHEEDSLEKTPALTARFLTALLSQEDAKELWEWEQIHAMVANLIESNPAEPALRPLCEQLGRLNSPRALEFRDRLR